MLHSENCNCFTNISSKICYNSRFVYVYFIRENPIFVCIFFVKATSSYICMFTLFQDWDVQDRFYFMPRFVRDLPENGKEILSMNIIMKYLLDSYTPVVDEMDLIRYLEMNQMDWLNNITEPLKGTSTLLKFFLVFLFYVLEFFF